MGKVFTITEGLENIGALKTGGQGSVYKGRRIGEIITAVKLLPTPIHTESIDDKNYIDFKNEVEKLKRVNETANPHVVKILSSGVTETGSFPFIEMEFIEGPDLEELLKPPHESVFTIKETIKVAEQLSNALAHCHKVEVRHGDIKSNNVKFNLKTGNYVLLDFGLAIMSDEQRRTSLRHAGAIEFMAPEQNEGQMFSQTDVYSYGVILFELLAGVVPFPLFDKGETARNNVRLAHMETPPPDILQLRQEKLPADWSEDKKQREMNVPRWLLDMIYKCLEKQPGNRFTDGIELNDYLVLNSTLTAQKVELTGSGLQTLQLENERLMKERAQLQQKLVDYREAKERQEKELLLLQDILTQKDAEVNELRTATGNYGENRSSGSGVSKSLFYTILFLAICLAAFAAYTVLNRSKVNESARLSRVDSTNSPEPDRNVQANRRVENNPSVKDELPEEEPVSPRNEETVTDTFQQDRQTNTGENRRPVDTATPARENQNVSPVDDAQQTQRESAGFYTVVSRAYFHDKPNTDTRRNAYIVHWNNAKLVPLEETDDFIYVVFKNNMGQTSTGWLRKSDLKWEAKSGD